MNLAYNEKLDKLVKQKDELNAQRDILEQEVKELKSIGKPQEQAFGEELDEAGIQEMKGNQFIELLKKQLDRLQEKNLKLQTENTVLNKEND